jgi:hypothetical protein
MFNDMGAVGILVWLLVFLVLVIVVVKLVEAI